MAWPTPAFDFYQPDSRRHPGPFATLGGFRERHVARIAQSVCDHLPENFTAQSNVTPNELGLWLVMVIGCCDRRRKRLLDAVDACGPE